MTMVPLRDILLVGSGGFLGAVLRYGMSGMVQRLNPFETFPFGTLAVNLAGCLMIGLLGGLIELRGVLTPEARIFLLIGLLGGFTTFSTFGYDAINLLRGGDHLRAFAYVGVHLIAGLGAVWLGLVAARSIAGTP